MMKFCNFDLFSVQQSAKELDYLIRESTQKVKRIKTDNKNVPISFLASVNSCPHRLFFRILVCFFRAIGQVWRKVSTISFSRLVLQFRNFATRVSVV